jgi:hypothetical protein
LLLIANLTWPLVLLAGLWGGFDALDGVQFWQVYFVTMPHRWITLGLVFLDRQQFQQAPKSYVAVALVVAALCMATYGLTGGLTCLLAIDYAWNAWHFAAQHHGVFRIYGRLADPGRTTGLLAEKIALRGFLLYVILRVAAGTWAWPALEAWLLAADWLALAIPAFLLGRELFAWSPAGLGRLAYAASMLTLYAALLLAVHHRQPRLVLTLAAASALFHATEYLSLVTWAVGRKRSRGQGAAGLFGLIAAHWGLSLAAFALVLGLGGWLATRAGLEWWLLANVIVAYLHYAYDGMIWKLRRPVSYAN